MSAEPVAIPGVLMRGGTSKGLFLHARDLPPAGSRYRVVTGAPGRGTPGTTWVPALVTRPPGVGTSASIATPVLPLRSRTVVAGSPAATRPSSIANGPTAVVRLPQLPDQSTIGRSMPTCPNQYRTS